MFSNLKVLDLSGTRLRDFEMLCLQLWNMPLQSLILKKCGLKDKQGAYLLADMLMKNHTLRELNLHANKITHLGLNALSHALAMSNKTLNYLDLSQNQSLHYTDALYSLLSKNTGLKYFLFDGVNTDEFVNLAEALTFNKNLKKVWLPLGTY